MPVFLIDKIKPKNGGSFPMVDAEDVQMPDGSRLSKASFGGVSSWNNLADRPFGYFPLSVLAEGSVDCQTSFGGSSINGVTDLYYAEIDRIDITSGEAYSITVDGVELMGTAFSSSSDDNIMLATDASDGGSFLAFWNGLIEGKTAVFSSQGTHSYKITVMQLKKISYDFLPFPALGQAEILPETAVPFTYEEDMGYAVFVYAPAPYTLTAGETYFVVADGVTYKCVAKELEGIVFIGDEGAALGAFQGDYPFILAWIPETGEEVACLFAAYNSSEDISVNIRMYQCADDGKIMQVVGGAWTAVSVADSAIATYIDDYINTALGGDY